MSSGASQDTKPASRVSEGLTPYELRAGDLPGADNHPVGDLDAFVEPSNVLDSSLLDQASAILCSSSLVLSEIRATEINNGRLTEKIIEEGASYVETCDSSASVVLRSWRPEFYFSMSTTRSDGKNVMLVEREPVPSGLNSDPEQVARNICFNPGFNALSFSRDFFMDLKREAVAEVQNGYKRSRFGEPQLDRIEAKVDHFLYDAAAHVDPELRPAYLKVLKNSSALIESEGFQALTEALLEIRANVEKQVAEFLTDELLQTALEDWKQDLSGTWKQALHDKGQAGNVYGQDVEMMLEMIDAFSIDRQEEVSLNSIKLAGRFFADFVSKIAEISEDTGDLIALSDLALADVFESIAFSLDAYHHAQIEVRTYYWSSLFDEVPSLP